jgi:hypothetical protein
MKVKVIIPTVINESVLKPWSSEKVIKFARRMLEEPDPTAAMQLILRRAKGKREGESTEEYMHRLRNMIRASDMLEELIKQGAKPPSKQEKRPLRYDNETGELDPPLFKPRTSRQNLDDIFKPPSNSRSRSAKILRPKFPKN